MSRFVAGAMTGFGLGMFGIGGTLAIIGGFDVEALASLVAGCCLIALGLVGDVCREVRRDG